MRDWAEYQVIARFYGDRTATRSGVRLMNHINEGLAILDRLNASEHAKRAFCIHPLVQNGEGPDVSHSPFYALACEYRDRANAYLCRPETDHIASVAQVREVVGPMSWDCALMLQADKEQNRKDFQAFHLGTHPRSAQLAAYFDLWLEYLSSILRPTSYFRYEEVLRGTGYTDEVGEYVSTGSYVELQLQEFEVLRHTPCGVRINDYMRSSQPHGRFISRDWNKQWACPTVEQARQSFIARKRRQASILEARLRQAKEAMKLAEGGFASSGDRLYRDRKALPTSVPWMLGRKPDWARETA